jgi:hypothetical protein
MRNLQRPMPGHMLIVALLGNPMLTHTDIASQLGVSTSTVARVSSTLAKLSQDNAIELNSYKMLVRDKLPADIRVGTLRKAVDKADSNPFAALKAVEYADSILGLGPKQQQTEQVADNTRPMFMLPAGTSISVSITTPDSAIDIEADTVDP